MNHNLLASLEALLFIHGDPLPFKKAAALLETSQPELESAIQKLAAALAGADRGLALISDNESIQIVTKPACSWLIEKIAQEDFKNELSPAALETLSIIAYSGPISRAALEHIRGVNSNFTLRHLLLRGLVTCDNEQYQTSVDFLKQLGFIAVNQLPEYEKFAKINHSHPDHPGRPAN